MLGYASGESERKGVIAFSSSSYWGSVSSKAYVYNSNSTIYSHVENYKIYLESHGVKIEEARLIKLQELESLGCSSSSNSCLSAPSWVYATSYWAGNYISMDFISNVKSSGELLFDSCTIKSYYGARPVIVLTI